MLGYFIFVMLPGLVISLLATMYVKSTFARYSGVSTRRGLTGAEAAAKLLAREGLRDVAIEETEGFLSDHYDPSAKVLRLSPGVFESNSVSAIGVACHEAGHAIQHATGYKYLKVRSALVPVTNVCSFLSYFIMGAGLFLSPFMAMMGAVVFSAALLFAVVTLPVEWDASRRARELMVEAGIVDSDEAEFSGRVLNAAFMTYVASVLTSLLTVLYFLFKAGVFGGGRSDD